MVSINQLGYEIAKNLIDRADALQIAIHSLENGSTAIDCGIQVPGSLEAGRLFSEICLGGLGEVSFCQLDYGSIPLPAVCVTVRRPVTACMASQYAGWAVKKDKYFAMGSGPARSLFAGEALFNELDYRDQSNVAVIALEGREIPPPEVADKIATKCGVESDHLIILIAPTASLVGSVQVAARVVETGMHKMHEIGFDIRLVQSGFGSCPLAPIAKTDLKAIGRTNDGVLYGGRAWYVVKTEDKVIQQMVDRLPSMASHDYGLPFYELLKRFDGDFYRIDPLLFSPAVVSINNMSSGKFFSAGQINSEMLQKSLLS